MLRKCILNSDKFCNDCGECEICDIDREKLCDNCCRCLGDADYKGVEITEIILPKEIKMKYKRANKKETDQPK